MPGLRLSYVLLLCGLLPTGGCALTGEGAGKDSEELSESIDSNIQVSARVLEPDEPAVQANAAQKLDDPQVRMLLRSLERTGRHSPRELASLQRTLLQASPENRQVLISMLEQQPVPPTWNHLQTSTAEDAATGYPTAARRLSHPPQQQFTNIAELRDDYPRTGGASSAAAEHDDSRKELMPPLEYVAAGVQVRGVSSQREEGAAEADELRRASHLREISGEDDWHGAINRAIQQLEGELADNPRSDAAADLETRLRLLYLVGQRREEALRPIPDLEAAQQDFWSKEIYGLTTLMDGRRGGDLSRRASEANNYLRLASIRLGELSPPQVKNLAFCQAVRSYGIIERFKTDEFRPGQEVLLYAEIEGFKSNPTPEGYHTALEASYSIVDERGTPMKDEPLPVVEEVCQNRRRDFFVNYRIKLPAEHLYPGRHFLELKITDQNNNRFGTGRIDFVVKTK